MFVKKSISARLLAYKIKRKLRQLINISFFTGLIIFFYTITSLFTHALPQLFFIKFFYIFEHLILVIGYIL
jgi:hypothetical protein